MKILDNKVIVNEGSIEKIQPIFKDLVEEAIDKINSRFKPLAIYLRGSLSEGKGLEKLSDIDLVVFVDAAPSEIERRDVLKIIASLESDFSVVSEVDITLLDYQLLMSEDYKRLRVYLKTQSCLLLGKNMLSDIIDFKADEDLVRFMYSKIKEELTDLHSYFKNDEVRSYLSRPRDSSFWCRWTMRTILRSALGLVMFNKPIYTPNLPKCVEIVSKEFPNLKNDMAQVLEYELRPTNNKQELVSFLNDFLPKYFSFWDRIL